MTLWLRLFFQILLSFNKPKFKSIGEKSKLRYRVWPFDLDPYLHMNNAKYFSYMEVARMDLMWRLGFFKQAKKRGWTVPIAGEYCQFLRPLRLFQKFTITTQILHMDEKWIFIEHEFYRRGRLAARGIVRLVVFKKGAFVPTQEVADILGYDLSLAPPAPPVQKWQEFEQVLRARPPETQ